MRENMQGSFQNKVCVVIVSFNGGIEIINTIKSLINQVDFILIIDNASDNASKKILNNIENKKVEIFYNDKNKGIGYALNLGIKFCLERKIKWMLTMDQDSTASDNMVKILKFYGEKLESNNVVSMSPRIVLDGQTTSKKIKEIEYKDTVITSGNLINIEKLKDDEIRFDELMFIDNIDFDFCLKLKGANYRIVKCNEAKLFHNWGEVKKIDFKLFTIKYFRHCTIRKYYMARNFVVMLKRYCIKNPIFSVKIILGVPRFIFRDIVLDNEKIKSAKYTILGIKDGVFNKLGKIQ